MKLELEAELEAEVEVPYVEAETDFLLEAEVETNSPFPAQPRHFAGSGRGNKLTASAQP